MGDLVVGTNMYTTNTCINCADYQHTVVFTSLQTHIISIVVNAILTNVSSNILKSIGVL